MRIEGIQGVLRADPSAMVARLRDVSRARLDPSPNRLIAATGHVPNVTAPAPTRRLTVEERSFVEAIQQVEAPRVRRQADAPASAAPPVTVFRPQGPPPSLPIVPNTETPETQRRAARTAFGREVSAAYERTASESPGRSFDITT